MLSILFIEELIDSVSSVDTLVVIGIGISIGFVALLIAQIYNSKQITKLVDSKYRDNVEDAERRAQDIIEEAQGKARDIVTAAEEQSHRIVTDHAAEAKTARDNYLRLLEELEEDLVDKLTESANQTHEHSEQIVTAFTRFLEDQRGEVSTKLDEAAQNIANIPEGIESEARTITQSFKERVDQAAAVLEERVDTLQGESTEQIQTYLKNKFAEVESDINTYRQSRKEIINNHIEVLVEDVVRVVLGKELSRHEHVNLVHQALEEAKESGVI